jgi:gliding motility-associated-like protein
MTGSYSLSINGNISTVKIDGYERTAGNYTTSIGTHSVEYTDIHGCTGFDTFNIPYANPMTLSYAVSPGDCGSTNLSLSLTIRGGEAPYIINDKPSRSGFITLYDVAAGHDTIVVKDAEGCIHVATLQLYVQGGKMTSDTGVVDTICSGAMFKYYPKSDIETAHYLWIRDAQPYISEPYEEGNDSISEVLTNITKEPVQVRYKYVIKDAGACTIDTIDVIVVVNPISTMDTRHSPIDGSKVMLGSPITIFAESTGEAIDTFIFTYRTITATTDSGEYDVYLFDNNKEDTVKIKAINKYGCVSTAEEHFTAQYELPNTITPQEATNKVLLRGFDIQVFDRWGSLIYSGNQGWDGTYKGALVASGTYYYVINLEINGNKQPIKHYVFVSYK